MASAEKEHKNISYFFIGIAFLAWTAVKLAMLALLNFAIAR